MLLMTVENLLKVLFMAQVASTCSLSLFSICWNLSSSMAGELMTSGNSCGGGQGVVDGNQGFFTFLGIRSFVLLSCTDQCPAERVFYCKGNSNSLDEQLFSQDLARGNPK
jgi:hypothetical protein